MITCPEYMISSKPKIVVVVGPTASGKTALAINIAKKFSGEVISSDSRQVYTGLDIGTEKVTPEEMSNIPHHLIDIVEPKIIYTAFDFKKDAEKAIQDIQQRGKLPIIAGGTFFYLDILLGRIKTPKVPPNPELRVELEKLDTASLYKRLEALDPRRASTIDSQNHRRLIRAIEIANSLGEVPKLKSIDCPYEVLMIGINTDKQELRTRLRKRAEEALTKGLVEETEQLLKTGVSRERLSEIGLEYRVVLDYLDNKLSPEELIQKLEEKNWQYAKKQLLWLKNDESIEWFNPEQAEDILNRVAEWLQDSE